MINRTAIILKYMEPAVKWINEADPYDENPGITIDSVNEDGTVYLVRDEDADSPEALDEWISLNYEILFEAELEDCYTDESLWPPKRNLKLFKQWFEVEYHSVVEDTVGSPIEDDET